MTAGRRAINTGAIDEHRHTQCGSQKATMTLATTHTTYRTERAGDDVAQLVARAADHDGLAWNALVDRFGGVVWAVTRAHRLSAADAADVAQYTWMRLVENLDQIREPEYLSTWLATTARRECLSLIRQAARTIPYGDELPERPSDDPHPGERLSRQERRKAVHAAVERLDLRHRVLLRMLSSQPKPSYEEIGTTLGMPIGSIGPTRARALEHLRREVVRAGMTPELALGSLH